MSLPHRVARVTFSGTMFSGAEEWSTGFYMGFEGQDAPAITETGVSNISQAWQTFFQHSGSYVSSLYSYSMCKVHMVERDGKTIPDSAKYYSPPAEVKGFGGAAVMPPQVALVCSLANSLPRGLATKGRMFLPGICAPLTLNGRVDAGQVITIADNMQTFFNTIYQDADTPGNPVLASTGRGALLTDGAIRNVTQIKVGDVYDTQRRRRNALAELYTIRPVSVG